MNPQKTCAILVVSFGTAVKATRILTLEAIENSIRDAYPDCAHYRAWTSRMLREKVLAAENLEIDSVAEALSHIKQENICNVFIQPLFVTDGGEYHKLLQETMEFRNQFATLRIGSPLLEREANLPSIVSAIVHDYPQLQSDEFLILMGHGTTDGEDHLYEALDAAFKASGCDRIFLKTMHSAAAMDELISIAHDRRISKITLAPFMIAAGRHALKDMAGEHENSWKSRFEQAGFHVQCVMKGLGENTDIQQMFIRKIDI